MLIYLILQLTPLKRFILKMEDDYDIYGDLEEDIIFNSEDTAVAFSNLLLSIFLNALLLIYLDCDASSAAQQLH